MKASGCARACAAAAVLLAVAGTARGQENGLPAKAVTAFFEKMEQDATRMVRDGDYASLAGWAEENLAEEATVFASQEVYAGERRRSFGVMWLERDDMVRLSRLTADFLSRLPPDALRDYSLDIEVVKVTPAGPDAATATTRIVESGRFLLSGGAQEGHSAVRQDAPRPAGAQLAEAGPVAFRATAECRHLLKRDESGGPMRLGMTDCQAKLRF